ncbi:MAG: TIR domain-containing protein [Vicinamibacterales bacterium]
MPGVFICYRRDDVPGPVGRLFDRLTSHFGDELVFMDVASLGAGEHFDAATERRLSQCSVVLVAIGPRWAVGLDHPDNFGRRELLATLRLELPLVPVLVDGTEVPDADRLAPELHPVLRCQAVAVAHATFDRDVVALIARIEAEYLPVPRGVRRRQLERALGQSDGPLACLASPLRLLGPWGLTLGGLAIVLLAAGGAAWPAYDRGWTAGYTSGNQAATAAYELAAAEERNADLVLRGFVTDGTQGIGDAVVHVTNQTSQESTSARTGQFGRYAVDLKDIGISEDSILEVDVTKPPFRPSRDIIQYRDGIEHRSILLPR